MIKVSERDARLWCIVLGGVAGIAAGLAQLLAGQLNVAAIGIATGLALSGLAYAYWRNWEPARLVAVVVYTIAVIMAVDPSQLLEGVVLSSTFALLLAGPWWVIGLGAITFVGIGVRSLIAFGALRTVVLSEIPVMIMLVGIMAITRFALELERERGLNLAKEAQAAQASTEIFAAQQSQQATVLAKQNEEQRRLLELVTTLETPTVMIAEGFILAPLIGTFDSRRAESLTRRLLVLVNEQRAHHVLLDMSGVPEVDSAVAQSLMRTVQALKLLGCDVSVSGIAAPVAATMAQLGLDLAGVKAWRSPQQALDTMRAEITG